MIRENIQKLANSYFTDYPTRTKKKTKKAFIDRTKEGFRELGYTDQEILEQKSFWGGTNFVVGPPDADYVFTAHYDTPGRNGWLALPFSRVLGMGLSSAIGAMVPFLILFVLNFATGAVRGTVVGEGTVEIYALTIEFLPFLLTVMMMILLFAIKNPHNHNDNTSGCIGVYNVATIILDYPELRNRCAFVLFDNEEVGLFGSMAFAKWRRKKYPEKKHSLFINMDCIADGDVLIVASGEKPIVRDEREKLAQFLSDKGFETIQKRSSLLGYLSDHAHFRKGMMLAFARRSKLGGLYLPNIHTAKDRVCNLEQIERLCDSVVRYVGREAEE